MFDIGLQETLLVGGMALLVFGPGKLPALGRMVGRAMREVRRASADSRSTVETTLPLNDPEPVIAPEASAPEPAAPTTLPSEAEPAVAGPVPAGGPAGG